MKMPATNDFFMPRKSSSSKTNTLFNVNSQKAATNQSDVSSSTHASNVMVTNASKRKCGNFAFSDSQRPVCSHPNSSSRNVTESDMVEVTKSNVIKVHQRWSKFENSQASSIKLNWSKSITPATKYGLRRSQGEKNRTEGTGLTEPDKHLSSNN